MSSVYWMYDDTDTTLIPPNPEAVAAYVDGRWANYGLAAAKFPHARLLSIAVFASDDAECLDVEPGDATNADIYDWFKRQQARKVWKPCVYSSASNIDALVATMTANGFPRDAFRLWSAHYTGTAHVCGPSSCGATRTACDATQFTNHALARSLDETEATAGFFGTVPPPPKGPFQQVVPARNTKSLHQVALDRNLKDESGIIALSRSVLNPVNLAAFNAYVAYNDAAVAARMPHPPMGSGLIYWTENE